MSNHRWSNPTKLAGCDTATGNDETRRTCLACELVKITVHPPVGYPWKEYESPKFPGVRFQTLPPCVPQRQTEDVT